MPDIDPVIYQPIRLRLMAALAALGPKEPADFVSVRDLLNATDGNLGAHIQKLEDAGYIAVEKAFIDRKPRTFLSITTKGRHAFEEHVAALKEIIGKSPKHK